jgi:Ni2+-binding GTPase involved in maturation of urease and hydrogenase
VEKKKLILVGGFLGTGKTTLLSQTARRLYEQGLQVGMITNDQAPGLVDTGLLKAQGWAVGEVAGGCFCCRFEDLVGNANTLIESFDPDVILGEPVGSCTDLSATVLQPVKEKLADRFDLAPFTVLIDPLRLKDALDPNPQTGLHASARYILRKQLEEADIVALNKSDQVSEADYDLLREKLRQQFPDTTLVSMSALTGNGVPEWLELVGQSTSAGGRIAEVDYDTYAEGEAVLGWLNATLLLVPGKPIDWGEWTLGFLRGLQEVLSAKPAEVGHVKMFMASAGGGSLTASLTSTHAKPAMVGRFRGASTVKLILNARVQTSPAELRSIIEQQLQEACGESIQLQIATMESFRPGRPEPVHRYKQVVKMTE